MVEEEFSDDNGTSRSLPQPATAGALPFRYVKFEEVGKMFFDDFPTGSTNLPLDTLCWVMLSKGKNKTPQLYERARANPEIGDEHDRMTVRYPSGKTYRVRKTNLSPVLEKHDHLILVASETTDYRRIATVHTTKEDNFIEIGCDFGILVDSVDAKTTLGVDKSEESIKIARGRYPNRDFILGDIFEDDLGIESRSPYVVAIDINGNRMLPAVLDCIQVVVDKWAPRLIVVKSRELYARLE